MIAIISRILFTEGKGLRFKVWDQCFRVCGLGLVSVLGLGVHRFLFLASRPFAATAAAGSKLDPSQRPAKISNSEAPKS